MPTAWRIVKPYRAADAFTGEGARLFGGRWNSVGTPMVYAAATKSLAALEIMVHVDAADLLDEYLCLPVHFDRRRQRSLDFGSLPEDWRNPMPSPATQLLGDVWAASCESAVLEVPSVLIPGESNYLLNPRHPNIGKLRMGPPEPFEFDPRLLKQA